MLVGSKDKSKSNLFREYLAEQLQTFFVHEKLKTNEIMM